jgi:hypothetical protein
MSEMRSSILKEDADGHLRVVETSHVSEVERLALRGAHFELAAHVNEARTLELRLTRSRELAAGARKRYDAAIGELAEKYKLGPDDLVNLDTGAIERKAKPDATAE